MSKTAKLHVVKKKNGNFQFYFEKIYSPTRERCYGTFPTEKEAWEEGRRAYNQYYGTRSDNIPRNLTYQEFASIWLDNEVARHSSPPTVENYFKRLRLYIFPQIGSKPLQTILPIDLDMILNNEFEKGRSRNTLVCIKAILTKSFKYAVKNQYIQNNPALYIEIPNKTKNPKIATKTHLHHYLSDQQMYDIFKELEDNSLYTMIVAIGYYCGLRLGEIFGLWWEDVDLDHKTLTVRRQLQYRKDLKRSKEDIKASNGTSNKGNGYWFFKEPKYGSTRTILLDNMMVTFFKMWRNAQFNAAGDPFIHHYSNYVDCEQSGTVFEQRILEPDDKNGVLFHPVLTHYDGRYANSNVCQHLSYRIHKFNKDFDMHSLRLTHSTILQNRGFDIRYIADRMGHINLKTTIEVYYKLPKHIIEEQNEMYRQFTEEMAEENCLLDGTFVFDLDEIRDDKNPGLTSKMDKVKW